MLVWLLAHMIWIHRLFTEWFDSLEKLPTGYTPEEEVFLIKAENNWYNWIYLSIIGVLGCCGAVKCIWHVCPFLCCALWRPFRRANKKSE